MRGLRPPTVMQKRSWVWFLSPALQFIILVVDSTDRERLAISKEELYRMLAHEVMHERGNHLHSGVVIGVPRTVSLFHPLPSFRICGKQLCWYLPISKIWRIAWVQQRSPLTSRSAPSKTTPGTYSPAVHSQEKGETHMFDWFLFFFLNF